MIRIYRYLFYRLYSWDLKTWGKINNIPHFKAMLWISLLMFENVIVFGLLIELIFRLLGKNYFSVFDGVVVDIEILICYGSIVLVNYLWFLKNNNYLGIAKKYKSENNSLRKKKTIYAWLFIFVSFLLFIVLTIVNSKLKRGEL